ncbi:MAG: DUF3810 domain-containing protein [Ruminococcaceae bacterium]|nr:DUF3810 domain-containing protein [Oscillospiraceae bacterium]
MRAWFLRHKKLHIWLMVTLLFLATYFALRRSRTLMNALANYVTTPLKRGMASLCSLTEISVAEVLYIALAAVTIFYAANVVRALVAGPHRGRTLYRFVLTVLCTGLTIYAGFCLLWGVNYHTDSFQDRSGIVARQGTAEELRTLTERFAAELSRAANTVPRDENGLFAGDRREILAAAVSVYENAYEAIPCLRWPDVTPKAFCCSRAMTAMDFTGFYFPFTGEANVNIDCPAAFLPSTAVHEMAHQRQIASEQECNFVAIAVSTMSDDPLYRYSGWLMGYVHLSNALYSADREAWQTVRDTLPAAVVADIHANNEYWAANHTSFTEATQKVYDSFIKTNGDPNGVKSYGMVVDMLLAYYG